MPHIELQSEGSHKCGCVCKESTGQGARQCVAKEWQLGLPSSEQSECAQRHDSLNAKMPQLQVKWVGGKEWVL
eukprot:2317728-Amphidinium_carterae.2